MRKKLLEHYAEINVDKYFFISLEEYKITIRIIHIQKQNYRLILPKLAIDSGIHGPPPHTHTHTKQHGRGGSKTYRIKKFSMGFYRLDSIILTKGSILSWAIPN